MKCHVSGCRRQAGDVCCLRCLVSERQTYFRPAHFPFGPQKGAFYRGQFSCHLAARIDNNGKANKFNLSLTKLNPDFDRDHLRSNMGIISGPGSFAVQFGDHLRSWDHLRTLTDLNFDTQPLGAHNHVE